MDNPTPLILNPSDLPTRRRRSVSPTHAVTTSQRRPLFAGLIPPQPSYIVDEGYSSPTSSPSSPSSSPKSGPRSSETLTSSTSPEKGAHPQRSAGDGQEGEQEQEEAEEIDTQEIFDLISSISDPEHPLSLGSLAVVSLPDIHIRAPTSSASKISIVEVLITPTITHCSLATVIGLGVRVRLEQSLPPRFRIDVRIKEGTHSSGEAVNKQLADKERVAAAMENGTLVGVIRNMLSTCE